MTISPKRIFSLLALISCSSFSLAATIDGDGSTPTTPDPSYIQQNIGSNEDQVYLGLQWRWGKAQVPQIVFGYRKTKLDSQRDTDGYDISLSYDAKKGFDRLRLKGFKGDLDKQGELNLGYSFDKQAFFMGAGAHAPHINLGIDYDFGKDFTPYVTVNTLKKLEAKLIRVEEEPQQDTDDDIGM